MVLSKLGRKILNQTKLPQDNLELMWWIEKRLQSIKINGLVKMINEAKTDDYNKIDKLAFKYGWSARDDIEIINISRHKWFFVDFIQRFDEDFSWDLWNKIVKISHKDKLHMIIIREAMHIAIQKGVNLAYVIAVFESKLKEIMSLHTKTMQAIVMSDNDMADRKKEEQKEITKESKIKWNECKDLT